MSTDTKEKVEQVTLCEEVPQEKKKTKKRRRRFGDRADGRKLRTIIPMHRIMPYIMAKAK